MLGKTQPKPQSEPRYGSGLRLVCNRGHGLGHPDRVVRIADRGGPDEVVARDESRAEGT
jgi:hypothetical protein